MPKILKVSALVLLISVTGVIYWIMDNSGEDGMATLLPDQDLVSDQKLDGSANMDVEEDGLRMQNAAGDSPDQQQRYLGSSASRLTLSREENASVEEEGADSFWQTDELESDEFQPFTGIEVERVGAGKVADSETVAEDIQEYEDALKEAYSLAKESGDREFLTAIMGQMRELRELTVGSAEVGSRSSGASSKPASANDQTTASNDGGEAETEQNLAALDPPEDPEIEYDCHQDLTRFGEFQCPCPSNDLYNPRWREAFNPEFLIDKNCQY